LRQFFNELAATAFVLKCVPEVFHGEN